MPVSVIIKTRVRSDAAGFGDRRPDIEAALLRAVGRALARSRGEVLEKQAEGVRVRVHTPDITWTGARVDDVLPADRRTIEDFLRAALARAVDAAGLGLEGTARDDMPQDGPPPGEVGEPFDPSRFDPATNTYAIPSYQPRPNPGAPTAVPLQPSTGAGIQVHFSNMEGATEAEQAEALRLLLAGDLKGFRDLMTDRSDEGLSVLTRMAAKDPAKFLKFLRSVIDANAKDIADDLERRPDDLYGKTMFKGYQRRLDVVLETFPAAKTVLRERAQKTPGIMELIGLSKALAETRWKLFAYLWNGPETTDSDLLMQIKAETDSLPLRVGHFLAASGTDKAKALLPDFLKDLTENIRWILAVTDKVREIDSLLGVFRTFFSAAMDKMEEVMVLREARNLYLKPVRDNPVPTTARIAEVMKAANDLYDGWSKKAADRRLEKIRQILDGLSKLVNKVDLKKSSHKGRVSKGAADYNTRLDAFYRDELGLSGRLQTINFFSHAWSREAYLREVSKLEQDVPLVVTHFQLLQFWKLSLDVWDVITDNPLVGSRNEQGDWGRALFAIQEEAKLQYDAPAYDKLKASYDRWNAQISSIQGWINFYMKLNFYAYLGLTVVAMVVTAGVGSALGGGLALEVILAEAGTFTLITTVGKVALLGQPLNPAEVAVEFGENALMFGALKVLNLGFAAAAAKLIAPEKTLLQVLFVFGANTAVVTSVPIIIGRLEHTAMSDDSKAMLVINVVVSAVMMAFGSPKLTEGFENLTDAELADRLKILESLRKSSAEADALLKQLDAFIKSPDLPPEDFAKLQDRVKDVFPEFRKLLERLAGPEFTDPVLKKLNLDRGQLRELAQMVQKAADLIAGAKYVATKPAGLPAPSQSLKLVATGAGTYEYNPGAAGQSTAEVTARLRGQGYTVTDEGGGVLRLSLPSAPDQSILLLPAAEPGAPAFDRPLLERAAGYRPPAEMAQLVADLNRILPDLPAVLESEFGGNTALATLDLLIEQRANLPKRWPIDSIRGLAEMFKLERGVTRAAIRRLFKTLKPEQLTDLFGKYQKITKNPGVRPGSEYLVSEEIPPERSVELIDLFDALRRANYDLPEGMSRKAIQGLLRWVREARADGLDVPKEIAARLDKIPVVKNRLQALEAASPIKDPSLSAYEAVLDRHRPALAPGLSLLQMTPPEAVAAVENLAKTSGGRFSDAGERAVFEKTVGEYLKSVEKIKNAKEVSKSIEGEILRAAGFRREIETIVAALEQGAEIFASGKPIKVEGVPDSDVRLKIDPAMFKLTRGFVVKNAPVDAEVQIDVGKQTIEGKIVVEEVTTQKLELPPELNDLVPGKSTASGGEIDFRALEKSSPSGRKFAQMIKLRAAKIFAEQFLNAFKGLSGQPGRIPPPDMVIRVGSAEADAIAVAESLGFKVEVNKPAASANKPAPGTK
ncbi:MAG TPA: hypothetical protein VG406_13780 [Isosphaeraceae bacterium]|jgi:hypothetical protein|nr:hypothetical protein [Isosphaeraceae bacterium]